MTPFLTCIIIVVGSTLCLSLLDEFLGSDGLDMLFVHDLLDTVPHRGGDEDVDHVGIVSQDVVGTTAYKDARPFLSSLPDGIALELEKALLREVRLVKAASAQMGCLHVEQPTEKALPLIVLLEDLLGETTLLCSQIQQLTIVILGVEVEREHPTDVVTAAPQLAPYIDNDFIRHAS